MKKWVTLALLIGLVGGLIWYLEQPSTGVEPVAWSDATCSHCNMHLADRRFAAQLHTESGEAHNFDDPGCLFEWIEKNGPSLDRAYFRHYERDEWLDHREVGFVRVDEPTPMGYGLGAVSKAALPDAMSFGEASNAVLSGRIEADRPSSPGAGPGGDKPHSKQHR